MYLAGCAAIRTRAFDLAFISTTAFNFFCLGPLWRRRFGLPFVLDFQDPWYRETSGPQTTKHLIKAKVSNALARYMEAYSVRHAEGLIAVSPNYLSVLKKRYPRAPAFENGNAVTIPFGGMSSDFTLHTRDANERGRALRVAYVGVGSVLMRRSFQRIARGLRRLRRHQPALVSRLRIELRGTDANWRAGQHKVLKYEADLAGVGDLVAEDPTLVPYSEAAAVAAAADALLVLGIDDPAYMPSKLFSYASLGKPLLACVHHKSQINEYFSVYPELGTVIHFGLPDSEENAEDVRIAAFLEQITNPRHLDRSRIFRAHSAEAMTQRIADLFLKCAINPPDKSVSRD
jgi:hypothetical protein